MNNFLKQSEKNWNNLAKEDPLWAILSDPSRKGEKWKIKDFFESGEKEIIELFNWLNKNKISVNFGRALDFGCGVGRLSNPLASMFSQVFGVDISSKMIELAKCYSQYPEDKLCFLVNKVDNLDIFQDNFFDFIYTNITLQHIKQDFALKYIDSFLKKIKKDGIVVFQVESFKKNITGTCKDFLKTVLSPIINLSRENRINMYYIDIQEVDSLIIKNSSKALLIDKKEIKTIYGTIFSYVYVLKSNKINH
ncbi:MAG: class I SAM-dependent methyltransferase [Candidatus Pacebacteria bacterium]|nr:class I SAM-dependent methyltransferase [Candidatus Paceibacterota bacterium]